MQTAGENTDDPPTRSGVASGAAPEPVEALLEAYIRHVCGPQEAERLTEVAAGHLATTNGEGGLAGEDPAAAVGRAAREAALGWLAADARRIGRRLSGGRCHTIPVLLGERSEGRISARDLDRLYRHLSGCAQCAGLAARYDGAEWTLRRELARKGTVFSVRQAPATTAPAPPTGTEQTQAGDAEGAATGRVEEGATAEATQASALAEETAAARAAQAQAVADEAAAAAAQILHGEAASAAQAGALAEQAAAARAAQAAALSEEADLARGALAATLAVTGGLAREAQAAALAVEAERGRVSQAVELDRAAALARAAQAVELAEATELALRAQTAELARAASEARAGPASQAQDR